MSSLDLARWQFGLTTTLHFAVVGVSIGLVFFVALLQTRHLRTGDERWLRLSKYYGRAMLLVFAVGVVTGIIQTFQFGMNWGGFSRYVGDVFGAPLALEGLAAFFVESVFLGLWIFGRGKLSPRLHLACLWIVCAAAMLSAYAILVANAWMQHPVGYELRDGRAHLTDLSAVLLNTNVLLTTAHVLLSSLLTGAVVVLGIACWNLAGGRDTGAFGAVAQTACTIGLVVGIGAATFGHFQGVLAVEQQPMKMAAAEALYKTESPAGLSLFALGGLDANPGGTILNIRVPALLSVIDSLSLGQVRGIDDLQAASVAEDGPGNYVPIVGAMYWSFRTMVGAGMGLIALMAIGCRLAARGRLTSTGWFLKAAPFAVALPLVAQAGGWLLREGGRQPWVVTGLLRTADGVSPQVGVLAVALSLAAFLAVYGVIFAVAGRVIVRELALGLPEGSSTEEEAEVAEGGLPATTRHRPDASTGGLALTY